MKRREIAPAILKKFGIGYADEQWDSLYQYLLSQGVDKKIMVELFLSTVMPSSAASFSTASEKSRL